MDPREYRDARWHALLRAAADLGRAPRSEAPALVEQVLAEQRADPPGRGPRPAGPRGARDAVLGPPRDRRSRRRRPRGGGRRRRPGRGRPVVALTRPEPPPADHLRADQVPSLFGLRRRRGPRRCSRTAASTSRCGRSAPARCADRVLGSASPPAGHAGTARGDHGRPSTRRCRRTSTCLTRLRRPRGRLAVRSTSPTGAARRRRSPTRVLRRLRQRRRRARPARGRRPGRWGGRPDRSRGRATGGARPTTACRALPSRRRSPLPTGGAASRRPPCPATPGAPLADRRRPRRRRGCPLTIDLDRARRRDRRRRAVDRPDRSGCRSVTTATAVGSRRRALPGASVVGVSTCSGTTTGRSRAQTRNTAADDEHHQARPTGWR